MQQPKLIAIVGGSGAGKTWLARRLEEQLRPDASRLSLDDFYQDRASLSPEQRESLNYDHPLAIDWSWFESVLRNCRNGKNTRIPRYSFVTHTRLFPGRAFTPTGVILAEGLWLLVRPEVASLFDLTIYLECPLHLRLERRLKRDVVERGRKSVAVREQFWKSVTPMHDRYVAPQAATADIVLNPPCHPLEIARVADRIRNLERSDAADDFLPASTPSEAALTPSTAIKHTALEHA